MPEALSVLLAVHETTVRQRLRALLAGYPSVEIVAQCSTGVHALSALREHEPSVAILDAQMPDLDAFAIVAEIGPEAMPSTLFLTAFDRVILRVLEIHAVNYLLLPLDEDRVHAALARTLRQAEGRRLAAGRRRLGRLLAEDEEGSKARRIPVRNAGKTHFVDLDDILWVERAGRFARLHLEDRTHAVRADLDELAERFADDFVRIHSVLVRSSELAEIRLSEDGASLVELRDGQHLRIRQGEPPEVGIGEQPSPMGA